MNSKVALRKCTDYDTDIVYHNISDIYRACSGPDLHNKKVLIKPNVLTDSAPEKCVTTHPVVIEALIRFLKEKGATVYAGDSPSIHLKGFRPDKSGISRVLEVSNVPWIDFNRKPGEIKLRNGKIRIASVINDVDLIFSVPKLKNHELVYFTGAIKNTLGLVPGFSKAKQHALHQDRESFSRFLVDLNESVTQHFYLMDGIIGMEGPGPGQGKPVKTGVLIGSSNPLALDVIASRIAGYNPRDIPTSRIALARGLWLHSFEEIEYDGPVIDTIVKTDFKRIPISQNGNISFKFIKNRLQFLRKLERRPVFNPLNCSGCRECIKICPQNAIVMDPHIKNHVVLTDRKCIRCFCCSEVCRYNAVTIKRKLIGV
ncbi:MAG: DUF362 domain-containing protein [Bacteroidota bacterium]|nr:DUF362 domain-containing protein [Bacteroidota bacterium]